MKLHESVRDNRARFKINDEMTTFIHDDGDIHTTMSKWREKERKKDPKNKRGNKSNYYYFCLHVKRKNVSAYVLVFVQRIIRSCWCRITRGTHIREQKMMKKRHQCTIRIYVRAYTLQRQTKRSGHNEQSRGEPSAAVTVSFILLPFWYCTY